MDEIYIGMVDCARGDENRSLAEACLSAEEQQRYERLRQPLSRRCFVEGRRLARQMLGRLAACAPDSLHISIDDEGKPAFPALPGWHFNISHSGILAACVVARQPVGMDLEYHKPGKSRLEVADRFFTPAECAEIDQSGDHLERFYHYWTLKEAWLKQRGWGLGYLSQVPEFRFAPDGSIGLLADSNTGAGPSCPDLGAANSASGIAVWNLQLPTAAPGSSQAEAPGLWSLAIAAGSAWQLVPDPAFSLGPQAEWRLCFRGPGAAGSAAPAGRTGLPPG